MNHRVPNQARIAVVLTKKTRAKKVKVNHLNGWTVLALSFIASMSMKSQSLHHSQEDVQDSINKIKDNSECIKNVPETSFKAISKQKV